MSYKKRSLPSANGLMSAEQCPSFGAINILLLKKFTKSKISGIRFKNRISPKTLFYDFKLLLNIIQIIRFVL